MYQNPMEIEKPDNQKKRITIEKNVTSQSRLIAILLAPAILVGGYFKIFIKGNNTY